MGSCCRRTKGAAVPTSFCATITMATPIVFQDTGNGVEPTLLVGAERVSLAKALAQFSCASTPSVGVRLAEIVAKTTTAAWNKNPAKVKELMNRGMPLLSAKDRIFSILDKCGFCQGIGCSNCNNEGFKS